MSLHKTPITVTTGRKAKRSQETEARINVDTPLTRHQRSSAAIIADVGANKRVEFYLDHRALSSIVDDLGGRAIRHQAEEAAKRAAESEAAGHSGEVWAGRLFGLITAARLLEDGGHDRHGGFTEDQKEAERMIEAARAEHAREVARSREIQRQMSEGMGREGA